MPIGPLGNDESPSPAEYFGFADIAAALAGRLFGDRPADGRRHGVGQWAPERFSVTTPAMIRPTPTTLATDRGEPRNSTAISTIAAVPIADHSA